MRNWFRWMVDFFWFTGEDMQEDVDPHREPKSEYYFYRP